MARKTTPKKLKLGYKLEINRTGKPGAKNWERVGCLFGTSLEGSAFRERHHADVKIWRVSAVRVSAEKVVPIAFGNENGVSFK